MGKMKEIDRKARAGEKLTDAEQSLMIGKIIEDQQKLQIKKDTISVRKKSLLIGFVVGASLVSIANFLYLTLGV